jgi:hypothetical protein
MEWLLTVPTDVDLDALADELALLDAELRGDGPVPLGPGEQVVGATGPSDLPDRIRAANLPVLQINPDSGLTLY